MTPLPGVCIVCRKPVVWVGRSWREAGNRGARHTHSTLGRVLWPAGANWTSGKREVIVELAPIGKDGTCTGCGAKPSRETGSCRCLPAVAAALDATGTWSA